MFPIDIVIEMPRNIADPASSSRLRSSESGRTGSSVGERSRLVQRPVRRMMHLISAVLATMALQAAARPPESPAPAKSQIQSHAKAPMVATFAGEYVDGAPLYHLPSISVVTTRKAALARLESDEQATHAKQARAKTASANPVLAASKTDLAQSEPSRCATHAKDHAKPTPANGRGRQCS